VLNRLFVVTLWSKTLVLRKDKVTQCKQQNSENTHMHKHQHRQIHTK